MYLKYKYAFLRSSYGNYKRKKLLNKLPQTLLFGNGLNYSIADSWKKLLLRLQKDNILNHDTLPNTMIYEQILLNRLLVDPNNILDEEYDIKMEVSKYMEKLEIPEIYKKIIELNFSNYITTNYDNIFIEAYKEFYSKEIEIKNKSTETIYSIRRYKQLNNCKLWHIHGEVEQPKSIMLGMDQYIGSVSKIDDYIKGKYKFSNKKINHSIEDKINLVGEFDNMSWIELFFNSDIHILGFGLDYSEIDLWWILNKRSRLMNKLNIENKIFFYVREELYSNDKHISTPDNSVFDNVKIYNQKVKLLRSFKVIVKEINCEYSELYQKAISEIESYNSKKRFNYYL